MGLHIAIIGGGISGLSAAYYLQQRAQQQGLSGLQITVYERKAVLGGNADTVFVQLGEQRTAPDAPPEPYVRWADLGVNDVNLATYRRLKAALADIGYLAHLRPLCDNESYFTPECHTLFTDDGDAPGTVSDPRHDLAQADAGRLLPLMRVVHARACERVSGEHGQAPVPASYTVGQYFADCMAAPEAQLAGTAARLGIAIDWQDPALPTRIARIRDELYYPRISAMYFTDPVSGPAGMPLLSPFQYYLIQEGQDPATGRPDRRYFEWGSQHWLATLAQALVARSDDSVRVTVCTGHAAQVTVSASGAVVQAGEGPAQAVDLVLMALHADDALKALHIPNGADLGPELTRILGQVRYTRSYAACHTDDRLLPANRNSWRTYNVLAHPVSQQAQPYRMSYVENWHQNDRAHPRYNEAGLPVFFTTLTPDLHAVDPSMVLERAGGEHLPSTARAALPHLALAAAAQPATGYTETHAPAGLTHHGGKAWTLFKHNVLDAGCLQAQVQIAAFNEKNAASPQWPLFFGGGWTRGAGLHEQCMAQSECMAGWALDYLARQHTR